LHLRLRSFTSIPKIINAMQPDLVIEMAHFGPFKLDQNIDQATVIHDITPLLFPEWHDRMSYYGHKWTLNGLIKKAKHLIVNSHVTRKDLETYFPESKEKTSIGYPSILTDLTSTSPENIYGQYFLSVGTIEPRKNYDLLIEAFENIAAKNDKLKLIIVGHKGWKSKSVFEKIKSSKFSDRIIVEGYVSDDRIIQLYRHALAFIFPTLYEGFGIPLLEALSFGLPILASDIDICHEVCEDAALYFNSKNVLCEQMQMLIDDHTLVISMQKKALQRSGFFNDSKLSLDAIFL